MAKFENGDLDARARGGWRVDLPHWGDFIG